MGNERRARGDRQAASQKKNANIELKDSRYGWTPLSRASSNGHKAVMKLLVEKGADIKVKDGSGQTILQVASEGGHLEVVDRLLAAKADGNAAATQYNGRTAL